MKAIAGFTAVMLFCLPLGALAQEAGGMMQGAGSAAAGAAKQAGGNAAGQMMQNMGMMSPSPSPAASPAAASPDAQHNPPLWFRPRRHQLLGCRRRHRRHRQPLDWSRSALSARGTVGPAAALLTLSPKLLAGCGKRVPEP